MFIPFLFFLLALITESLGFKNVPLPLIASAMNRHREELKGYWERSVRSQPTRAVVAEPVKRKLTADAYAMTHDEYIRNLVNSGVGLP
jgi:hypothetical protein